MNKDLNQYLVSDFKYVSNKFIVYYMINPSKPGFSKAFLVQKKQYNNRIDDYNHLDNNKEMS